MNTEINNLTNELGFRRTFRYSRPVDRKLLAGQFSLSWADVSRGCSHTWEKLGSNPCPPNTPAAPLARKGDVHYEQVKLRATGCAGHNLNRPGEDCDYRLPHIIQCPEYSPSLRDCLISKRLRANLTLSSTHLSLEEPGSAIDIPYFRLGGREKSSLGSLPTRDSQVCLHSAGLEPRLVGTAVVPESSISALPSVQEVRGSHKRVASQASNSQVYLTISPSNGDIFVTPVDMSHSSHAGVIGEVGDVHYGPRYVLVGQIPCSDTETASEYAGSTPALPIKLVQFIVGLFAQGFRNCLPKTV